MQSFCYFSTMESIMELLLLIISEPSAGPQTKRWRRGMSGLQGDAFWSFVLTRVIIPLKLSTGCKVLADIYVYIHIYIALHHSSSVCDHLQCGDWERGARGMYFGLFADKSNARWSWSNSHLRFIYVSPGMLWVFFLCLAAWNAVSQVRQTDWWLTDYLDFDQLSSIAVTHSTPSEEPACVTVEICHQPTNQQHSLWIFFLEQVTGSYHIVTPMKIPIWVYWLLFICLAL